MTDRWTDVQRPPAGPCQPEYLIKTKGERDTKRQARQREREDRRGGEWKNLSFSSNDRSNQLMRLFNEIQMMREKQK